VVPQLDGGVFQSMLLRAQDPEMEVRRSQARLQPESFGESDFRPGKVVLLPED